MCAHARAHHVLNRPTFKHNMTKNTSDGHTNTLHVSSRDLQYLLDVKGHLVFFPFFFFYSVRAILLNVTK